MVHVLLTDADIVTMAAGARPARSMLVRDGRIAAVGPAERVPAAAEPGARVVGLEGAAVIPGLIVLHPAGLRRSLT
jgi:predicted amidohydrolase YtcJ